MSPREWKDRVHDILDAIDEIQHFTRDMDFETFRDDDRTIRAVEMNFIIIGEAASLIPDEVTEKHIDIPWHLMRAMRNRMVHAYFQVDEKLMWDTVKNDLPPLALALKNVV